ncbi:molybdopterin molybdotransferase MoeA [bacterium]|nr:molybdopterin molybdotransferase MoeA [bacterium]
MINTEEAIAILKNISLLGFEKKPLSDAMGNALAEDILADRDIPPSDRSAMDGYAVRSDDFEKLPCELELVGEIAAGSAFQPQIAKGTCVRIMTGANIPPGADSVVVFEKAQEGERSVFFHLPVKRGENIMRQGEDAKTGETLIAKGTILGPLQIGVCASVGKAGVLVFRKPQVAVLCTGEELRDVHESVETHELRNSNGPALCAALDSFGYDVVESQIIKDSVNDLSREIANAANFSDVILLTGGVSKGKYDFVRSAVEKIGASIVFHGVAMKPGKPLLYAKLERNRHIFGLPGNPLSAMTGFFEFVVPALRVLSGINPNECRPSMFLKLSSKVTTKGGRAHFVQAKLEWGKEGPHVVPLVSHSSADLVCGGRSDGVIAVPPEVREIEPGSLVEFHSWKPL